MNSNSVIEINLKCLNNNHQENIEFYCETCNIIPMCKECIPSHKNHSINIYDINKQDQLITYFNSSIKEYQNEVVFLNQELSRLKNQFEETQINTNNKINLIEEEFKQLHKILEVERLNLIRQIETYQDENNQQFINKKSKIENKIQIINQSINRFINKKIINSLDQQQLLNSIQEKRYIEINKFNYQINEINKELPPFFEVIQPFNYIDLKINNNKNDINNIPIIFDDDQQTQFKFIDFINNTYSIENKRKIKTINNNNYIVSENSEYNKFINDYNCYILTSDNTTQPNDNTTPSNNIILCLDNSFIKKNKYNNEILDQFKTIILHHQIKSNDNSVPIAHKFSICYYQHRIPNYEIQEQYSKNSSFGKFLFQADFKNIQLNIRKIPEGLYKLELHNIEQALDIESIPSSVKTLCIHDGFKHQLLKGIIPEGVETLTLYNIEQPLEIGSIPLSVKFIRIYDEFRHQLNKGVIPEKVETLILGNLKQPLEIGSIPSSVKDLRIHDGFKHQLTKGIIPDGVETLTLYNIEQPLEIGSIPSSVKSLHIKDGFKHQLNKGIIPDGLEKLIIGNIKQTLEIGSIPSSVKDLDIQNGFKHQLIDGIMPEGIFTVSIYSSSIKLKDISIPKSVQNIYIQQDDIIIDSDIINNNFKNIKQLYLTEKRYNTIDIDKMLNKQLIISIITKKQKK